MDFKNRLKSGVKKRLDFILPAFICKGLIQYSPRQRIAMDHKVAVVHCPPLISVVIPSYNQGRFLEQTIKSVLQQEYPRLELIIVDGGSTDQTLSIISKYQSKLRWWCSEQDSGQANAINKGFNHANGEILSWLNADDCYMPNALAKVANYFVENENVDVVYGNRLLVDENNFEIGKWILPSHDDKILSWIDIIPQETLFWRRDVWEKVGCRLDESLDFAIDWDLLLRFRETDAQMVCIPSYLGQFRVHSKQKTSQHISETGFKEMDILRQRCHGFAPSRMHCAIRGAGYLIKARIVDFFNHRRVS